MLPDDYIQKQRWALAQMEAWVESRTRYELTPESYNVASSVGDVETRSVAPFPDYDADPPPPEVYCQLLADDQSA